MSKSIIDTLENYLLELEKVSGWKEVNIVLSKIQSFISAAFEDNYSDNFERFKSYGSSEECRTGLIGFIDGLIAKTEHKTNENESYSSRDKATREVILNTQVVKNQKKVFIVHGRDNEAKEVLARFIEKIGLKPIILHEQPNSGRTIIEKFEIYSDVSFAIILLTPDDLGKLKEGTDSYKNRARQNVILELGYFVGKLGRNFVCALNKDNTEIPSDYHGILYIEFDEKGAWKTKLAQELIQAKIDIKLDGLIS